MPNHRNHDNTECYQMIWQFTLVPMMIAVGYYATVLLCLSYIGTSM